MPEEQSRVEDKYGKDIKKGDRVYFVFGGEHHSMTVDEIDAAQPPDSPYPHILRGTISVTVHAASVTRSYRDRKEERHEREEDFQRGTRASGSLDKAQQETETPEADKPKTHRTSHTTKKGSK